MKKIRKISMKTINKKVFVLALGMAMASLGCHGIERRERSQQEERLDKQLLEAAKSGQKD